MSTSTSNSTALDQQNWSSFDRKWRDCPAWVSGACSKLYVLRWVLDYTKLADTIVAVLSYVNGPKLNQKPRSFCATFTHGEMASSSDLMCVSWAAYYTRLMSVKEMESIGKNCASVCQELNRSCEIKIYENSAVDMQWYCISNRADGCASTNEIEDACTEPK